MGFKVQSMRGGLTEWDGPSATGLPKAGLFLLKGLETPEQLLGLACELEDGARQYYEAARDIFPKDDAERNAFASLARAEQSHHDKIAAALEAISPGSKCTAGDAGNNIAPAKENTGGNDESAAPYMEGGLTVEEALATLRAKAGDGPRRALVYSMGLEANALDFYLKFHRMVQDPGVREVISALINDEKAHLKILGRLIEGRFKPA